MSRATPVAVFFIETFAFGTPAPDASDTVPERLAPATCAWIGHASPESSNIANTTNKPQVVALIFAKTILPPRRTLPIGADSILSAVNSQQQFVKICTDPSKFQIFMPRRDLFRAALSRGTVLRGHRFELVLQICEAPLCAKCWRMCHLTASTGIFVVTG